MENNSQAPKRRGRPAGSKNKRTRVEGVGMGNNIGLNVNGLEVPAGSDVIAAIYDYANCHQLNGLSVMTTHGTVRTITLYRSNRPFSLITWKSDYKLLYITGNFYGSSSSIRPPSPFSPQHIATFITGEGRLHTGIIQGKLIAGTKMVLGFSFINGTEHVKLSLPPPPPPPRALPSSSLFLDSYGGLHTATSALTLAAARFRIATAGLLSGLMTATAGFTEFPLGAARFRTAPAGLPGLSSGATRSRIATAGLLSGLMTAAAGLTEFPLGAGRFRPEIAGLAELSSGAGRPMTATSGFTEFPVGAGRFRPATAHLAELSLGAGRFRPATDGLREFSSGAGSSRTAYGLPAAPSPSPLISCLMPNGNNLSSTFGQRSSAGPFGGQTVVERENNY
ncbi:uncharacterized protein LOC143561619 isoform X1 [Bidens hawaiensis]|uniref:uncharacterized protein LOC143561619 isoform X1 n=1 Tax=Bidens hawaiensis TaxID=980011 RepID=UPI004049DA06